MSKTVSDNAPFGANSPFFRIIKEGLAGLAASGETVVTPGYPIERGHASIVSRFNALGADIERF